LAMAEGLGRTPPGLVTGQKERNSQATLRVDNATVKVYP
jgi:hypothetical protein